jgi:hypothetical protein
LKICEGCPEPKCDGCPTADDPEYFRKIEGDVMRHDNRLVRNRFFISLIVGVYALCMGWFAWETHEVVTSHDTELHAIYALQRAHSGDLNEIKTDTQLVAGFAKTLENEIATNHNASAAILIQLCAKVPGCTVPPG